jgi:hypothetical protein
MVLYERQCGNIGRVLDPSCLSNSYLAYPFSSFPSSFDFSSGEETVHILNLLEFGMVSLHADGVALRGIFYVGQVKTLHSFPGDSLPHFIYISDLFLVGA